MPQYSHTGEWTTVTVTIKAVTTNPTKSSDQDPDKMSYRRVGDSMEMRMDYQQNTTGSAAAGSGGYVFIIPDGYEIDTNKVHALATISGDSPFAVCGGAMARNDTTQLLGTPHAYQGGVEDTTSASGIVLYVDSGAPAPVSNSRFPLTNNNVGYSFVAVVPIQGW